MHQSMTEDSDQQYSASEKRVSDATELLKIALVETQQSIRSYDTKSQICAIGYLFSLSIVLGINESLFPVAESGIWVVIVGWGVLILPMLFYGYVLYPSRRSVLVDERDEPDIHQKVLYIRGERHRSAKQIQEAALQSSALEELAFELHQSSDLRDRKRIRFLRALGSSFLSLLIMFLIHLMVVLGY